jgi:hypothetical protein
MPFKVDLGLSAKGCRFSSGVNMVFMFFMRIDVNIHAMQAADLHDVHAFSQLNVTERIS